MNKTTLWIIILAVLVILVGSFVYYERQNAAVKPLTNFVSNFEDCAEAGYPVQESYPRKCVTPEGQEYVEDVTKSNQGQSTAAAGEGCYIGGCSQQICSDQPDAMSTCEYKPEYSCYQNARCEKQSDGKCGWTETDVLTQCLTLKLGEIGK